jgi:hypothetical protein
MPVLAFEVIRSSGAFPPSWPRHAYRQSPPGFALRIVRRLHCDPSRNALRNPSLKRLGENRRLIVYGDIGMCKETDTRPFAHPYVRSKRPSLRPDLLSLAQGGGRRSRRAAGHRKAARSVLEGHPPSCDALARGGGRSVTLPLPTIPTRVGKRTGEAHQQTRRQPRQPSASCSTWNGPRPAGYSTTEPTPLNRA